jgi:hypothetical protein
MELGRFTVLFSNQRGEVKEVNPMTCYTGGDFVLEHTKRMLQQAILSPDSTPRGEWCFQFMYDG